MTTPDTSSWKTTPDGIPIPPPSPDDVLYEARDGGIAWITLNRPLVLNAMNKNVQRLLLAAVERAEADEAVKVLVLTGAGRAFSAGGDMWASLYPDDEPAPTGTQVQTRIWGLSKPSVAAVRGHAVGQGCELAGSCDLTIASENARFGEVQIRQGFAPPMLITPYLVNLKKAKEIMLLGEALDAREAQQAGLVNRVVPDEELETAAEAVARKLAALPQNTVRLDKALTNRVYELAGFHQGIGWQQEESLRELAGAHDPVAAERQRARAEQGWATFKEKRDSGYER
ncbi:MAG: enoyl-CoA hydratase/isomerase family protein [Dehalococcoidia bacterium]|nr:enoyl-CoA hydratase/isomerase family protein [Dehalococcoidia bacterium]